MRKFVMASAVMMTALSAPFAQSPAHAHARQEAILAEQDKAMQLAQLLMNERAVEVSLEAGFETQFRKGLTANPTSAELFNDNPDLVVLLIDNIKPILTEKMIADLPNVQSKLAVMLNDQLSADQIASSLTFFKSDAGQKSYWAGLDTGARFGTNSDETKNRINDLTKDFMKDLSPEDLELATRFLLSGAPEKLSAIAPQLNKLSVEWGAQISEDNKDVILSETLETLSKYFEDK